jgi:acetyltransferase-like isoleucine patch superfamily enzyme
MYRVKPVLLRVLVSLQYIGRALVFRVRFIGRPVRIDPSSTVSWRSVFRTFGGGSISIGKNCEIDAFAMLTTYGGNISIGDHCSLNSFAIVYGHGGVKIGNGVRIAAHAIIIPANHKIPAEGHLLYQSGLTMKGITIGNNVWIGAGAKILDGVCIESNAVIGAGSVVTKAVPARTTVAGVPAQVIRTRPG